MLSPSHSNLRSVSAPGLVVCNCGADPKRMATHLIREFQVPHANRHRPRRRAGGLAERALAGPSNLLCYLSSTTTRICTIQASMHTSANLDPTCLNAVIQKNQYEYY